jgi:hypothetical protein
MVEVTNADRANWALAALISFVEETRVDTAADAITDLIGNLLHLARGCGLDSGEILRNAATMARTESLEDAEGNMARIQAAFRKLLPEAA